MTRRTVTRGAAWSVPLVAVAVAAPAFTASGFIVDPVVTVFSGGRVGDDPVECLVAVEVTGLAPSTQYSYLNSYSNQQLGSSFTTDSSGTGRWSIVEVPDRTWTTQIFDASGEPVGPTQPVSSPQESFLSRC